MSKIVQILIKNTSTLDFSIPVLIELKRRGHEVIIIDLCLKKNVLSALYTDLLNEHSIQYVDRKYLLPKALQYPLDFLDRFEIGTFSIRVNEIFTGQKIIFSALRFAVRNIRSVLFQILRRLFYKVISLSTCLTGRLSLVLGECDAILWDHRARIPFYFEEFVTAHLSKYSGAIFLLPHAPHMRDPSTEIHLPITGHLNENYNYLLPLNCSDNVSAYSSYDAKFLHCGYPGLDKPWIKEVKSRTKDKRSSSVLIIMRPFSDENIDHNAKIDHYVLSYQEIVAWLTECKGHFCDKADQIYFKLHPSNSKLAVARLIQKLRFTVPTEILEEDIYTSVSKVDTVIGFYSTTLLIASAFGCKTYCMKTNLVDRSFDDWPILQKVYTDFGIKFIQLGGGSIKSSKNSRVIPLKYFLKNSTEFCANLFSRSL